MTHRKQRAKSPYSLSPAGVVIAFLFFGYYLFRKIPTNLQPSLLFVLIGILILSIISGIFIFVKMRQKRKLAWERAMANWSKTNRDGLPNNHLSVSLFSPQHLEKFAAQLFKDMGYRVTLTAVTGDHGIDVHMRNPNGEVELVQCKQWNHPVGEKEVREFAGVVVREGATRGYFFAPGGFASTANRWAKTDKFEIRLMDEEEIDRLVISVYGDRK